MPSVGAQYSPYPQRYPSGGPSAVPNNQRGVPYPQSPHQVRVCVPVFGVFVMVRLFGMFKASFRVFFSFDFLYSCGQYVDPSSRGAWPPSGLPPNASPGSSGGGVGGGPGNLPPSPQLQHGPPPSPSHAPSPSPQPPQPAPSPHQVRGICCSFRSA